VNNEQSEVCVERKRMRVAQNGNGADRGSSAHVWASGGGHGEGAVGVNGQRIKCRPEVKTSEQKERMMRSLQKGSSNANALV
jgi:hypothetical protein